MRTLAVLPVKGFDAAKQRLGGLLGAGSRQALAQAMFSDVLAALGRTRGLAGVAVVTADNTAQATARGRGTVVLTDESTTGQSDAALIGIRYALDERFDRVLLVPGDTPMLDAVELDELLDRSAEDGLEAVIVPDRHGEGTNALLLSPPGVLDPRFGPGSCRRHVRAAEEGGLKHRVESVPSLALDIDTPVDLAALADALEGRRGVAARTSGILRQLGRSRAFSRAADSPASETLRV